MEDFMLAANAAPVGRQKGVTEGGTKNGRHV
jgi:hypothetical protein